MVVNAALLAIVLTGAPLPSRSAWLATVLVVAVLRLAAWAVRRWRPASLSPRGWSGLHVVGAGINGGLWGSLPLLLFAPLDVAGHLFLSAVIVGMVAGSATSTLGHPTAFAAFAIPALAPLIFWLLQSPSGLENAAGLLACVFASAMWTLAHTGARTLTASLVHRFRNDALVAQLSSTTQELAKTNSSLEETVRQRTGELVELERRLSQSALLASVGSLAAAVAHDINNPLASLLSGVRHLEREASSATAREELEDIRASAERVRDIVRSLGDVARTDGGKGPLELREIVESCLAVASGELRGRVRVVRDLVDPGRVMGERGGLSRVFLGLILQVARAVPPGDPGGSELRIGARTREGQAVVEIYRHPPPSPGAPHADRSPDAPSLSQLHAIVALLGGAILVRPDGSGFVVTLPREPDPRAPP